MDVLWDMLELFELPTHEVQPVTSPAKGAQHVDDGRLWNAQRAADLAIPLLDLDELGEAAIPLVHNELLLGQRQPSVNSSRDRQSVDVWRWLRARVGFLLAP